MGQIMYELHSDKDHPQKIATCGEWFVDVYYTKFYNLAVSLSINIVNFVLRFVLMALIANIGEDTKSQ